MSMQHWWKTEPKAPDLLKIQTDDVVRERDISRAELFQSLRQCVRDQTELKIHRLNQEMRK